jgi:chromosome segregation ATPase
VVVSHSTRVSRHLCCRQRDQRKQNEKLTHARREIESFKARIRVEEEKIQQNADGSRAALEADVVQRRQERESVQKEMEDSSARITETEKDFEAKQQNLAAKEAEFNLKNNERGRYKQQKEQLEQRLANKWNIYGSRIGEVIKQVDGTQWRGGKPIGPLGDYVELRQREWIIPIKVAIGNLMGSWIVEHADDRPKLRDILVHYGKLVA